MGKTVVSISWTYIVSISCSRPWIEMLLTLDELETSFLSPLAHVYALKDSDWMVSAMEN